MPSYLTPQIELPGPIEQAFRAYLDVLPKLFVGMPNADSTHMFLAGMAYMDECVHKEQRGLTTAPGTPDVDLRAMSIIHQALLRFDTMPAQFKEAHASYRHFLADKYRELWALGGFTVEIEL